MITAYSGAAVWCIVQTALLAGLGLVAIWLLARRAPASAALVGLVAACMILLATLTIPIAIPALLPATVTDATAEHAAIATAGVAADAAAERAKAEVQVGLPPLLDVRALLGNLRTFARSGDAATSHGEASIGTIVLALFGLGAIVGLCRLALAVALVTKLRRRATPIGDDAVLRQFAELRALLGVNAQVAICESNDILSPALIGWRRPIILLPTGRTGWSDDQVRATLAHELVHVVRGDFVSRAASQLALALHFSQPLVHWLARRVTLMQELATDRLAAEAVGGVRPYARALSELALRLDDHSRLRLEPVVLPAISSHLTRRMAMLRIQDGTMVGGWRRVGGVFAATLIASVGVATIAVRGGAEPASPTASAVVARKAFDADPLDLSFMGPVNSGRLVVRPNRMTQQSALTPLVEFMQSALNASAAATDGLPAWRPRLETIDYYALQMYCYVDLQDSAALEKLRGPAFTADAAIRFTDDQSAADFWEQTQKSPKAEMIDGDGFSYVRVVAEPMKDQVPPEFVIALHIAKRDSRTFVLCDNIERLEGMLRVVPTAADSTDAASWAALDGGLFTLYGDKQPIELGVMVLASMWPQSMVFDKEFGEGMLILRNDIDSVGLGVDLDPEKNEIRLSVQLRCNDEAAAGRLTAALANLQGFAKGQLDDLLTHLNDPAEVSKMSANDRAEVDGHLCWTRFLAEAQIESTPAEGQTVELRFEASAPLPQQLAAMYGAGLPQLSAGQQPLIETKTSEAK